MKQGKEGGGGGAFLRLPAQNASCVLYTTYVHTRGIVAKGPLRTEASNRKQGTKRRKCSIRAPFHSLAKHAIAFPVKVGPAKKPKYKTFPAGIMKSLLRAAAPFRVPLFLVTGNLPFYLFRNSKGINLFFHCTLRHFLFLLPNCRQITSVSHAGRVPSFLPPTKGNGSASLLLSLPALRWLPCQEVPNEKGFLLCEKVANRRVAEGFENQISFLGQKRLILF